MQSKYVVMDAIEILYDDDDAPNRGIRMFQVPVKSEALGDFWRRL